MRRLLWLPIIVAALFGAFWVATATGVTRGLAAWFDQRRASGWVAEYSALKTGGFPTRFDTRIQGLELADPYSGLAWTAPVFRFTAPVTRPGNITAFWPASQMLATPEQKIEITSQDMRAAVLFTETTDLNLAHIGFDLTDVAMTSTDGWENRLDSGHLSMEQLSGPDFTYRVEFDARGLTPAASFLKMFERVTLLDDRIEGAELTAIVTFDAPWDRFAIERARPQPRRVELKIVKANWGELELWMAGDLDVNADGVPTGQIAVKARNWRQMVDMAREMGALPEELESSLVKTLGFLAKLSGDPDTLDTRLTFRNGYVAFGPIPLGPAPNLHIR